MRPWAFWPRPERSSAGLTGDFDMPIRIPRGEPDAVIERIIGALRAYEVEHPIARIDLYRQNPVSVRDRIVDPDFARQNKIERSKEAWKYLNALSDEVQSDISTLIL